MTENIAIATRFYRPYLGGAEVQAERLAHYVGSAGGVCEVVTTRYQSALRASESVGGVRVRRLRTGGWGLDKPLEFVRALIYFLMNAHRFAVVHVFCLSSFTLGALLAAKLRGVRTIAVACTLAEGSTSRVKGTLVGKLSWRLFIGADVILAPSEIARQDLLARGAPDASVRVLPHIATSGARTSPPQRAAARERLGLPERLTVLCIGRLEQAKGVDALLEAWPQVVAVSDAQLVLLGDGPLRESALRLGSELPRTNTIHARGWQSDPEPYYAASDVFVSPSRSETFGVALADAMAHGVAVVATPTGLARRWIEDQPDGVVIPPDDPRAIAAALLGLLQDEGKRSSLGERAQRRARETFGVQTVGAAYLAICRELVTGELAEIPLESTPADAVGQ